MAAHHVIVGTGIAGLTAAETIRARDATAKITMIGDESHNFYSRPGLAYLLRGDVPEQQLFLRSPFELRALRMDRIIGRVDKLYCGHHLLELSDGRRLTYDRLLLATGAQASPAPFPGNTLEGVVKLDNLDDARRILSSCGRFRAAVVVGGGITALELAEGLRARGTRTHYLLRGNRYWSDVLDETESRIILDRLQREGVRIRLETQVKQALGKRGRLSAIETQAGEIIPCHVLAVAIGVRPRIELAKQAGLTVDRGIVVDEYLRTSTADVFAAGDVAQVRDPRTGVAALDVLWPIALKQGQCAGANMLGEPQIYSKEVPFNVTQLTGLKVTIIGGVGGGRNDDLIAITRGESEAWRMRPKASVLSRRDDVNRVRILVDEKQIVGALVMGDQTWSRPLQKLIVEKVDATAIRSAIMGGGGDLLEQLAALYRQWEQQRAVQISAASMRQIRLGGSKS